MTANGTTSVSTSCFDSYVHLMTATGTISGSSYMLWQLLGLLMVVHTFIDSYWDQWQYLHVVTATGTTSGSAYIY